ESTDRLALEHHAHADPSGFTDALSRNHRHDNMAGGVEPHSPPTAGAPLHEKHPPPFLPSTPPPPPPLAPPPPQNHHTPPLHPSPALQTSGSRDQPESANSVMTGQDHCPLSRECT